MYELDPRLYTVAWIAPLEIEARAALHMFDNRHDGWFPTGPGDDYHYYPGDVCGHNVVLATFPAGHKYGTGSAAALAAQLKKFFPNLWFGLLVGVAAGLPNLSRSPPRDIRLGDVLVALSEGDSPGLIAYDLGKETGKDGFQLLHFGHGLPPTEAIVRSAIGSIKITAPNDTDKFLPFYEEMGGKEHRDGTFADPGQDKDVLYEVDEHGVERMVDRGRRQASRRTQVWYGPIGSGEKLMKNAQKRNELRDRYNVIGLEMEAAGTMDCIPVGVIRGVCDYGDEHKNKEWQPYAAAMAAAYAKAVLREIPPKKTSMVGSPATSTLLGSPSTSTSQGSPAMVTWTDGKNLNAGTHVSGGALNLTFSNPEGKFSRIPTTFHGSRISHSAARLSTALYHVIPFPPNEDVVHRTAIFSELDALLPPSNEYHSAALWGLGGSG